MRLFIYPTTKSLDKWEIRCRHRYLIIFLPHFSARDIGMINTTDIWEIGRKYASDHSLKFEEPYRELTWRDSNCLQVRPRKDGQ
jgi:hypothetical protein